MAEEAQAADNSAAPKKKPLKAIMAVAVVLIVEAVVIIGAMMMLGGPAKVEAQELPGHIEASEDDKIVEVPVLDARLANNKTGVTYLYNTEVFVQVKKKQSERVKAEIEQFKNEIKAEISAIWRTSEPHHFQEPKLENLTRKVEAMLNERFGRDKEMGEAVIQKCVIVMGTGFRIDS